MAGGCLRQTCIGGALEQFVNQGLVWLGLSGGQAAETSEQTGIDANRDELLGMAGFRTAYAAGALEFFRGRLRNAGEINPPIRNMPCAPCGSLGAHW